MSDGDNATPGHRRPPDQGRDNQWLTRTPRRSQGAAPGDRDPEAAEPTDNHTDGITVADLIAKVTGDRTGPPRGFERRRTEPESEPPTQILEPVAVEPLEPVNPQPVAPAYGDPDSQDTEIIPAAAAYGDDMPDLATRQRRVTPPHAHRNAMVAGRGLAALIAVLALVLTGGAWQWQSSKNSLLNKVSALDPDSRDIVDPNAQFGDENFLIVGVDSRIGENSDMGAGDTDDAAGARSDTVMLVNLPANRERVVAVSFPRDLAITPIVCEPWNPETGAYGPLWDDETQSYGPEEVYTETKLNSAYAFGGPKCLVKVIQKLSGLSINRFMAVDFAGFAKMVDALGGVEVCSTTPLEDYELGTVLAHSGRQIVDGHTALNYVRARQVTTEINGDYGRIKRQQLFLSSLMRSLISKEVFFSLSKLNNVVNMFIDDSYVDNIKTKDLVELGQSIQGVDAGRITFLTVPTTGYPDEYGNETPRTDDMRAMFDAIIDDEPLPGENADNILPSETPEPASATTTTGELVEAVATDPQDVTVRVSNSTGEDGLAATAASELALHGFNVTTPEDYPSSLTSTTVFFSAGNEQAAATVASAFDNPTIEQISGLGDVVQVVLGTDFYTVTAPSASGSPVQMHVLGGTSGTPIHLPEDLAVTNAADTTCE